MRFRIWCLFWVLAAGVLSARGEGVVVEGEVGARLDEFLARRQAEGYSGVALVAKDDRLLLRKGYGWADRRGQIPNSPDTVFPIGSITKQFTAAAVLKLEAQGKLAVEDPLSKHLEDVPADKAGVTLHHLLTHGAGFPESLGDDDEPIGREEFVKRALAAPLQFEPGGGYLYSNVGYSLLAAVVERVSGRSYDQFLRAELWGPAGMPRTGYRFDLPDRSDLARGYRGDRDWGTPWEHPWAPDGPYWNLRGNGGVLSTVGDMHRWILALRGDAVLPRAQREKLFRPYLPEGPEADTSYGYGWVIAQTPRGTRAITHNGGNGFFTNDLLWLPEEGLVIYLSSNSFEARAFRLTPEVARIALGGTPRVPTPAGARGPGWGFPDSPTGELAAALLTVLSDGGEPAARSFLRERTAPGFSMQPDRFVALVGRLHGDLGDFEATGVRRTGPDSVVVSLRSARSELHAELDLKIEPAEPPRLLALGVRVEAGDGPDGPPPFGSIEELDRDLERQAREGSFSGTVLAARLRGDPVFQKAYGWADKRFAAPNRLDTKFNLGSINKIFTSVAVLQLAEAGKLGLDDTLGRHLGGFPPEIADRVTIRHLLGHRSGWGAYWENPEYLANLTRLRSVGQLLGFIRKIPLDFEPGTRSQYSNVGFEVLGAIVEKVSGRDYYDYVRERIYTPAAMADTDSYDRDGPAENLATGYTNRHPSGSREGFRWENTLLFPPRGTPAGGGYSTVADMLRFVRALVSDKLLGSAYTDMLLGGFEDGGEIDRARLALGWGGGAEGVNAAVEIDLGRDWVVVVLSNLDPPAARRTASALMRTLAGG